MTAISSFSVLIIGAGSIGAFFDTPESEAILTHAHAFRKHPGFELLGFTDIDPAKSEHAARIWGGRSFENVWEAFTTQKIDVAVVAVPDEFHYSTLKELAGFPVRVVLTEKPLTKSLHEADEIIKLYEEKDIHLVLNYSRRFVPQFTELRDYIASGSFGNYLAGSGSYGKGTLHNGSHMIDLLRFLIGEIDDATGLSCISDCYDDDPSCSAILSFANGGNFFMQAVDCRKYTIFELDLFFERKRVRVINSGFGIELYDVRDSEMFAGYRNLVKCEAVSTSLGQALYHAADYVHACLTLGAAPVCSGNDGVAAMTICNKILDGFR